MKPPRPSFVVSAFLALLLALALIGETYNIAILKARLVEILQLALVLAIAWVVNGEVSQKVRMAEKRLDAALMYLDETASAISAIASQYESYIGSGDKTFARDIVAQFKKGRVVLARTERLMKTSNIGNIRRLQELFQEHKELLTDGEFLKDDPHFSEETQRRFEASSDKLLAQLEDLRVTLLTQ
jgi:hypothetical protein